MLDSDLKPWAKLYVKLDKQIAGYKTRFQSDILKFRQQGRLPYEFVVIGEEHLVQCGYLLADLDPSGTKTRKAARIGAQKVGVL